MIRRSIGAALSALFLIAVSAPPIAAQTPQPAAKKEAPAAAKPAKKPSAAQQAQRQKMKDCAAKWNEHKKATNEKGKAAHQKFMGNCLKG